MWATGRLSTYPQARSEELLEADRTCSGSRGSALELSVGIFYTHVFFEQATEFERAKVDVPDTVIDLLEPHVLPGAHDADVDPIPLPADAPVEAHVAHLEVPGCPSSIVSCSLFIIIPRCLRSSGFALFAWGGAATAVPRRCGRSLRRDCWTERLPGRDCSGFFDRKCKRDRHFPERQDIPDQIIAGLDSVRRQLLRRLPRNRPTEGLPSRSRECGRATVTDPGQTHTLVSFSHLSYFFTVGTWLE